MRRIVSAAMSLATARADHIGDTGLFDKPVWTQMSGPWTADRIDCKPQSRVGNPNFGVMKVI